MTSLAGVREEWHGPVPVAHVEGEVDIANVEDVAAGLRGLMSNRSTALIVDLSTTSYLDSAGINLLYAIGEELRSRQQTLRLVLPERAPVARVVTITSLDKAFATYRRLDEALAAS